MKRIGLALVGLACVSVVSLAGSVITNDTGEAAVGLRVTFSAPVLITSYGDALSSVEPEMLSYEFVFSGGTVQPWDSQWFNYTPATATIIETEWLTRVAAEDEAVSGVQEDGSPIVSGEILNPLYFAHGACVMQGVNDPDEIFAMPLLGVEELSFWPTVEGADPADVTWTLEEITAPGGICAEIRNDTLYIWGSDSTWAGYGDVTLTATTATGSSATVTIPVAVFQSDRTLVNSQGQKDYFVPWSPELDIGRILSVEEHMRMYNKDEGNLDRSIQWSPWKRVVFKWDIDFGGVWTCERGNERWSDQAQRALVDLFLAEVERLGIQRIRFWNSYWIETRSSTEILSYDTINFPGPTRHNDEMAYVANEAHRLGLEVSFGDLISVGQEDPFHEEELYFADPVPFPVFIENYETLLGTSLSFWQDLGVDMVDLCPALSSIRRYDNTYEQAESLNESIGQLAESARTLYDGPLFHTAHYQSEFFPGENIMTASFWDSLDIIGISQWGAEPLSERQDPSFAELVAGWLRLRTSYYEPFQERFNKPFILTETGSVPIEGCAKYGLVCPWVTGIDTSLLDPSDMAAYYLSQAEAFTGMPGYVGPGWWDYRFNPYAPDPGGVREAESSTPRLKIEDTIQEICLGQSTPPIIAIDGELGDWMPEYRIENDEVGDSRGKSDLLGIDFVEDEAYLYFCVRFDTTPIQESILILYLNLDEDADIEWTLSLDNIWTIRDDWCGNAFLYDNPQRQGRHFGFADAIDGSDGIEIRLAKCFLGKTQDFDNLGIRARYQTQRGTIWDETDWISISVIEASDPTSGGDLSAVSYAAEEPGLSGTLLPTSTTTHFPVDLPEPLESPSLEYSVTAVADFSSDGSLLIQPIDAIQPESSAAVEKWYGYSISDGQHSIRVLTPEVGSPVRYAYPEDGNRRYLALQYTQPIDLSGYEGLLIVASADHAVTMEIVVGTCDEKIPMEEDSPCGEGAATFATPLPLTTEPQVFILPFSQFDVFSQTLQEHPEASMEPSFYGVFDMVFRPTDETGVLTIHQVSALRQEMDVETIAPVINEYYFQHPAYVMQGVDDLDSIYALPLEGILELGTGYAAIDPDSEELMWTVETSDPSIGAGFQDDTLYIWGANADWFGSGEVTLSVSDETGASDSVTIPVTVFRRDKTLINQEGKKDYFVPWSPQLDINRIIAVEEHMRTYGKDEGSLDRSIQWSRWKRAEFKWDIDLGSQWTNEHVMHDGWSQQAQLQLVDIYLWEIAQLGIQSVRVWNDYYIQSHVSSEISPNYDSVFSPTKRGLEVAYIVNEAHRLGLDISLGNAVSIYYPDTGEWEELYAATPQSVEEYLEDFIELNDESLPVWKELGIDMVDLCVGLSSMHRYRNTYEEAVTLNAGILRIASEGREQYPGPFFHSAHYNANFFPEQSILEAPFWDAFDIIGISAWGIQLGNSWNTTLSRLTDAWEELIDGYFRPFQQRFGKPFLMSEIGCVAAQGCGRYGLMCSRMEGFDATKPSTDELAQYLLAHAQAFTDMEGFIRPGWWEYPVLPTKPGSVVDTVMTTFRMKADDIIQELCGSAVTSRIITIDASLEDWDEVSAATWDDTRGDTVGRHDLERFWFAEDDTYLYFRIDYDQEPTGYLRMEFDVDGDSQFDFYAGVTDHYYEGDGWWGSSELFLPGKVWFGIVDSIDVGTSVQLRIDKRFLSRFDTIPSLQVRLEHRDIDRGWKLDDEMEWMVLWN